MKLRLSASSSVFASLASLAGRVLRVASYLAVLWLVLFVLAVRSVHAESKKLALAIAEPIEELDAPPGGTLLTLNGQRLHVSRARVDAPLGAVLDRIERACGEHADGLADDLGDLAATFARPSERGVPGVGVLRDERDRRGVVACFATGERESLGTLAARLRRFSESLDLSDLGGLRYVAVHAAPDGSSIVTATWSDETLALDALFAARERGDAPGEDPSAAPRPAGPARRILSARVGHARYGVFVYEVAGAGALDAYEPALRARGFSRVTRGAYRREGVDLVVTEHTSVAGEEGTTLSIVESHHLEVGGMK